MSTLIVIDMQMGFAAAKDSNTVQEVCQLISLAKHRGSPIVVVEYKGCGMTNPSVTEAIGDYQPTLFVFKYQNDGSEEIIKRCAQSYISLSRIQVCGVYTSYCVKETIQSLLSKVSYCVVELIVRACNCNEYDAINAPWTRHNRLFKIETEAADEQRVYTRTGQLSSVHDR
jgi:nicotinamidase-related amidase